MKILNKVNTYIEKNQESILERIVNITKLIIFLAILPIISFSFKFPYQSVLNFFGNSSIVFLTLQLLYFTFIADSPQRNKIMHIWKVFFGVVSLMFIFMFSMDRYITNIETDYQKTKISYQLANKTDANEIFKKYEASIQKELNSSFYKAEEVKNILIYEDNNKNNNDNEQKHYKIFYANFALSVMLVMTYFMFLWSVTAIYELREEKKKNKPLPRYKKRLNEKKEILRERMMKK